MRLKVDVHGVRRSNDSNMSVFDVPAASSFVLNCADDTLIKGWSSAEWTNRKRPPPRHLLLALNSQSLAARHQTGTLTYFPTSSR